MTWTLDISLHNLGHRNQHLDRGTTKRMVFVLCAPGWYRASQEYQWRTCWACYGDSSVDCGYCKLWTVVKPGDPRRS